jgi:hypothetical protein
VGRNREVLAVDVPRNPHRASSSCLT